MENTGSDSANRNCDWFRRYDWEFTDHAPQSPSPSPGEIHFLGPLEKQLAGKSFAADGVKQAASSWLQALDKNVFYARIRTFVSRKDKWWILPGLMCNICYPYVAYTSKLRYITYQSILLPYFSKLNSITQFFHRFPSSFKRDMSIIYHEVCFKCFVEFHYNPANRQSTKKHNTYQLLYIYSIPPDDGMQICPKHVEVDWRNKLSINNAKNWFSLHGLPQSIR